MQTVLYIGGAAQGKRALAMRLHGLQEGDARLVYALHELVRADLSAGREPMARLASLRGKIVVCDEVGCGVIPLFGEDRAWREAVGRLCCALAAEADTVVRVCAGLPQVIKGALPCE